MGNHLYRWDEIQKLKDLAIRPEVASPFVEGSVRTGTPIVLRNPVGGALFTERDTLEVIRDIFLNPFRDLPNPKIILGDSELFSDYSNDPDGLAEKLLRLAPLPDEETVSSYVERVKRETGSSELFYYMKIRSANHPLLWFKVREVQKHIFNRMPYPAGGVELDIFFGDYSKTPTNIHRDGAGFIYVVSGSKKFHVWPFDRFSGLDSVKNDARLRPAYFLGESVRFEDAVATGIPLEGSRGDIIFWPDDHWHIAEGDGSIAITFCMSFFFNFSILSEIEPALQSIGAGDPQSLVPRELSKSGGSGPDVTPLNNELVTALDRWWKDTSVIYSRLREAYTLKQIERTSGAGFNQPFFPVRIDRESLIGVRLKCDPEFPLHHVVLGKVTHVAANGISSAFTDACEPLIPFLTWLNTGAEFTTDTATILFQETTRQSVNERERRTLESCLEFVLSMRAAFIVNGSGP